MSDNEEQTPGTPSSAGADYGDFPPGTIVLAKLKSFPPWPAIVIPDDLVPEGILASRPKSASGRSKRKSRASVGPAETSRLWCVRFLKDDTFMWATAGDITLLTRDQIESFLSSKKAKKMIKSAYEMALDPPDVEEFIIYGSDGKPIDIDNEADDADFQDEAASEEDFEEDEEDIESEVEDDIDLEIHSSPAKKSKKTPTKKKRATPAKTNKRTKTTRAKTPSKKRKLASSEPELDPDTSSDEDWDVLEDPDEDPVCIEYPDPKTIADHIKKRTPLFKKSKLQLQLALLSGKEIDSDLKTVTTVLDNLEKMDDVELALVKQTNLHKVLFDILKRPDLETKELKKIRSRIAGLVKEWFDAEIEIDEKWNFEELKEETEVKEEPEIKEENAQSEEKDADGDSEMKGADAE